MLHVRICAGVGGNLRPYRNLCHVNGFLEVAKCETELPSVLNLPRFHVHQSRAALSCAQCKWRAAQQDTLRLRDECTPIQSPRQRNNVATKVAPIEIPITSHISRSLA